MFGPKGAQKPATSQATTGQAATSHAATSHGQPSHGGAMFGAMGCGRGGRGAGDRGRIGAEGGGRASSQADSAATQAEAASSRPAAAPILRTAVSSAARGLTVACVRSPGRLTEEVILPISPARSRSPVLRRSGARFFHACGLTEEVVDLTGGDGPE